MFEYYGNVHVYCPGAGAYEPLGPISFRIIKIQSYCPFPARLSLYGGHLCHVTWNSYIHIRSPVLHIKFGFDWPRGFREEDLWKWWTTDDGRTTDYDGRTPGAYLSYQLTGEPSAQVS